MSGAMLQKWALDGVEQVGEQDSVIIVKVKQICGFKIYLKM